MSEEKKKIKIMTIVGTRPEIIKLSRVIAELERYTDHLLVHTGQNFDYELNEIFFQQMELKEPAYYLDAAGKSAAESISNIIARADEGTGQGIAGGAAALRRYEQLSLGDPGKAPQNSCFPHGGGEPLF